MATKPIASNQSVASGRPLEAPASPLSNDAGPSQARSSALQESIGGTRQSGPSDQPIRPRGSTSASGRGRHTSTSTGDTRSSASDGGSSLRDMLQDLDTLSLPQQVKVKLGIGRPGSGHRMSTPELPESVGHSSHTGVSLDEHEQDPDTSTSEAASPTPLAQQPSPLVRADSGASALSQPSMRADSDKSFGNLRPLTHFSPDIAEEAVEDAQLETPRAETSSQGAARFHARPPDIVLDQPRSRPGDPNTPVTNLNHLFPARADDRRPRAPEAATPPESPARVTVTNPNHIFPARKPSSKTIAKKLSGFFRNKI